VIILKWEELKNLPPEEKLQEAERLTILLYEMVVDELPKPIDAEAADLINRIGTIIRLASDDLK
jgi:hypothetical protein